MLLMQPIVVSVSCLIILRLSLRWVAGTECRSVRSLKNKSRSLSIVPIYCLRHTTWYSSVYMFVPLLLHYDDLSWLLQSDHRCWSEDSICNIDTRVIYTISKHMTRSARCLTRMASVSFLSCIYWAGWCSTKLVREHWDPGGGMTH